MSLTIVAIIVFSLTQVVCWVIKTNAARLQIIDHPNDRSSHEVPTPRGGGVAIFVCWSVGLTTLVLLGQLKLDQFWLTWAVSLLVALGGFWDDHRSVPASMRLVFQFAVAIFFAWQATGLTDILVWKTTIPLGIMGPVLSVLLIVWWINLYNFMDGINGIAAAQCLSACVSVVIVKNRFDLGSLPMELFLLLAVACAAFSCWNFPRARLFMGDAGSAGLGMFFAAATLIDAKSDGQMLWIWLVLLGGFIFDATYTLIRRALRRERLMDAHRKHVYQRLAISAGSHTPIAIAYFLISMVILLPIAILIASDQFAGITGFVIAYLILGLLTLGVEFYLRGQDDHHASCEAR